MDFPAPVISIAIEPKTQADQDKLGDGAGRSSPSRTRRSASRPTRRRARRIISGMGELHLEIIVDRLVREFKVEANVGRPQVAYRETIAREADAEGKYIRQTGGRGQYGHVALRVEPTRTGKGFVFENATVGGVDPARVHPGGRAGRARGAGARRARRLPDDRRRRSTLTGGSYHEVDSSEMAFEIAGSMGAQAAAREARRRSLLEPVMSVEVLTPDEFMGEVIGNLAARRGRVSGMEARGSAQAIAAEVPLATMFGYSTDVRSMTQGRATYTMQFSHYAPVPDPRHGSRSSSACEAPKASGGRAWPKKNSSGTSRT